VRRNGAGEEADETAANIFVFFFEGEGAGGEAAVLVDDSAGSRPLLPLLFLLGRAALLGSILRLPFLNPNPRNALDQSVNVFGRAKAGGWCWFVIRLPCFPDRSIFFGPLVLVLIH